MTRDLGHVDQRGYFFFRPGLRVPQAGEELVEQLSPGHRAGKLRTIIYGSGRVGHLKDGRPCSGIRGGRPRAVWQPKEPRASCTA